MRGTISSIWRTKACVSFKTKLDNDSDIDQSGCTALPTCRLHVVNGTHCVGVSVLTNRLREMHARGGHWLRGVKDSDKRLFLEGAGQYGGAPTTWISQYVYCDSCL